MKESMAETHGAYPSALKTRITNTPTMEDKQ